MTGADDHFHHDPEGLNSGTRPGVTTEDFITPVERFFRRSHAPVPVVDQGAWRLDVGGGVDRPASYSLDELLGTFPQRTLDATLVCAGLRRAEFLEIGSLQGELPWGLEPAGTGRWTGVALRDVLHAAGVGGGALHVELTGLDQIERGGHRFGFGGSIDLAKALSEEVLLATALNGEPLPAAHGFPLRAVVPGWIGARSVKWLRRIDVLSEPSDNYFFAKAYRILRDADPANPFDVSSGTAMGAVPLNALIVDPVPGTTVPAGRLRVRGWAMGTGGSALTSIEVSPNAGRDWAPAQTLLAGSAWTWTFWEASVDLAPGPHTLAVRAADRTGAAQTGDLGEAWNVKTYGNNAWHRVNVVAE